MTFPFTRMRRLRRTPALRELVAETMLRPSQLIHPIFVSNGSPQPSPVASMPGVFQQPLETIESDVEDALALGIATVLLFGVPDEKDTEASSAWDESGVIQQATKRLKDRFGDEVTVITDTCLCEYMTHGHCGIAIGGSVLNDPSVELLGRVALSQAAAGADMVAPSAMMDGQVAYIREVLDEGGYDHVPIMAYSAKYASSLYAPFRDAAESAPSHGNRSSYQMDYRNRREALRELVLDVGECADMVMVKPALFYMDVLREARNLTDLPLVAYSVSGEYSMLKAAAEKGWLDEEAVLMEYLFSLRRAGADAIITYAAKEAARWLNRQ
ncbi:MAG: porphobilinogen synthase [Vampirovibrionales bacterium]|nr:porphobilinogen synthase [Vampirovibrionales bacterium]